MVAGDVAVMDNNALIHHNPEFKQLFIARGIHLLFLPAYSPEMMPVVGSHLSHVS
jgi:transposase